jgi:hypothetical protein
MFTFLGPLGPVAMVLVLNYACRSVKYTATWVGKNALEYGMKSLKEMLESPSEKVARKTKNILGRSKKNGRVFKMKLCKHRDYKRALGIVNAVMNTKKKESFCGTLLSAAGRYLFHETKIGASEQVEAMLASTSCTCCKPVVPTQEDVSVPPQEELPDVSGIDGESVAKELFPDVVRKGSKSPTVKESSGRQIMQKIRKIELPTRFKKPAMIGPLTEKMTQKDDARKGSKKKMKKMVYCARK